MSYLYRTMKKKINLAYKLKYNRKRKNQVVLLMITDSEKWHYIALKKYVPMMNLIVPQEVYLD